MQKAKSKKKRTKKVAALDLDSDVSIDDGEVDVFNLSANGNIAQGITKNLLTFIEVNINSHRL